MTLLDERLRKIIISRERPAPRLIMNSHLLTGFTALGCLFLVSCYPYNENQNKKPVNKPDQKPLTAAEQKKVQDERDLLKQKEEAKKKEDLANRPPAGPENTVPDNLPKPTTPAGGAKPEYKFATKAPGKDGFVISPYNGKLVDVRDIPTGTLVQDPTYTGDGKGYFRVP